MMKRIFHIVLLSAAFAVALALSTGGGCNNSSPTQSKVATTPGADTTTNNFTISVDTIKEDDGTFVMNYGGLMTVFALNDTDAWVSDQFIDTNFNFWSAAHWDGRKWTLQKIYGSYQGQPYVTPGGPMVASNHNDIRMGMYHYYAGEWHADSAAEWPSSTKGHGTGAWGPNDNDIYGVSDQGEIVHWDGHTQTQMQSPTTLALLDVWGYNNGGGDTVFACGGSYSRNEGILLEYDGSAWKTVVHWLAGDSTGVLDGIYCANPHNLFMSGQVGYQGDPLHLHNSCDPYGLPDQMTYAATGYDSNDVYEVGDWQLIKHWNGKRWKVIYNLVYLDNYARFFHSASATTDGCFVLGDAETGAVVVFRLKRM